MAVYFKRIIAVLWLLRHKNSDFSFYKRRAKSNKGNSDESMFAGYWIISFTCRWRQNTS